MDWLESGWKKNLTIAAGCGLAGAIEGSFRFLYYLSSGQQVSFFRVVFTYIPVWLVASLGIMVLAWQASALADRVIRFRHVLSVVMVIMVAPIITLCFSTPFISIMRGRLHDISILLEIFFEDLVRLGVMITSLYIAGFLLFLHIEKNSALRRQRRAQKETEDPSRGIVVLKSGSRLQRVAVDDIDWIESAGNYAIVHRGDDEVLTRMSMKELESLLQSYTFSRVHRSAIINLQKVIAFHSAKAAPHVVLENGDTVKVSRNEVDSLRLHLNTSS